MIQRYDLAEDAHERRLVRRMLELESLNLPDVGVTDDQAAQIATLMNLKFMVLLQARAADKDKLSD